MISIVRLAVAACALAFAAPDLRAQSAPPELVKQIQEDLAKLGYDPGAADGSLSGKTQLAIASFEADNGLAFSGEASFELAFRLRDALNKAGTIQAPAAAQAGAHPPVAAAPATPSSAAPSPAVPSAPAAAPPAAAAGGGAAAMAADCESRSASDVGFNTCAVACASAARSIAQNPASIASQRAGQICAEQYQLALNRANAAAQQEVAKAAKAAAVDRSAVGSPAPNDYIYSYEFGPHLRLDPPGPRMRAVKVPGHAGKPRFGLPDSFGLNDPTKKNTLSSDQNTAYRVRLDELRVHRTAYALMTVMQLLEPAYSNTDRSRMLVGALQKHPGMTISQEDAREYQLRLLMIALASIVASPDVYPDYFCRKGVSCHPPTAISPGFASSWGGMMADEFAQRDAFQAYMRTDYDDLVSWAKSVPRDAVLVGYANLGEYDFDGQKFPGTIGSPNLNRELITGQLLQLSRVQDDSFDDHGSFELPMPPDQARTLRERLGSPVQRPLYAVSQIRFTEVQFNVNRPQLLYKALSPRVTIYFDEALTERLAEVEIARR